MMNGGPSNEMGVEATHVQHADLGQAAGRGRGPAVAGQGEGHTSSFSFCL